jgi:hypothetical protein
MPGFFAKNNIKEIAMFLSLIQVVRNNVSKIIVDTIGCSIAVLAANGINAAIITPSGCIHGPDSATCTLTELLPPFPVPGEPGTANVIVDEIRFGNWRFLGSDDALSIVRPEDVSVTFSENGRRINLDFFSERFFSGSGGLEGNYTFGYDVITRPGNETDRINKIDLSLLGYRIGGGPSEVSVSMCLSFDCFPTAFPDFRVFAENFGAEDEDVYSSTLLSPPLSSFPVSTNIFVSGSEILGEPPGFGETDHFRQSFYRIPEPGTLALIALPGLIVVGRRVVSNFKR